MRTFKTLSCKAPNQRMISLPFGQLGRLTARFFNVLVSLHLQSALQVARYTGRYMAF